MPLPMPSSTSPARTAGVASTPTSTAMPAAMSTKTAVTASSRGSRAPMSAKRTRPGIWEKPTRPTAKAANAAP